VLRTSVPEAATNIDSHLRGRKNDVHRSPSTGNDRSVESVAKTSRSQLPP
jgi:hypothetical protein